MDDIDIFVSYGRGDDEPFTGRLYDDLTSRGFRLWWDRRAMPTSLQEVGGQLASLGVRGIQFVSARAFMTTRWIRGWAAAGGVMVILAVLALPALSQPGDDDVLKVIPENYKLLFQNSFVRVIEARIPPGAEEKPHRHLRGVSVYMTNNTTETRILPDGQWVRSEPKAGTVNWSDASLHVLRNVGKSAIYTIRVELK